MRDQGASSFGKRNHYPFLYPRPFRIQPKLDMALIIGLGTNLGDKLDNLKRAKTLLMGHFNYIAESRLYFSPAEDYLDQPEFINQVMEFECPESSPEQIMAILLQIELEMGRKRLIPKGPRIIDLDILFIGTNSFRTSLVEIPHPRLFQRIFVVQPLKDLPYYSVLKNVFNFPTFYSSLRVLN
jgi:2-amino-4-hydroxy-6-hydroxymethyldihydropteridine diphosphokinase